MPRSQQKTFVDKLADAGEEAIQRLGGAPGADRLLGVVNGLRDRMDEMQRKMRGYDALEKRLDAIERRLDKIEGKTTPTARKRSTSSSQAKKTTS